MSKDSLQENKTAVQKDIQAEKTAAINRQADAFVFSNQVKTEKILISGEEEKFGSLEQELTSLSTMSETRLSERHQAFVKDTMFAQDVKLQMRDSSYLEATAELNRRKHTKSHRYDKTRNSRMETSRKTLARVNDDIQKLKDRLKEAEEGEAPMKLMNKIESMETIYANIRVADRNCAEAMALNKVEEQRLKDKADLTYRKNLKKMYEHEMESLDKESKDYAALKKRWEINERVYNRLMRPVLEQQEKNRQTQVKKEVLEKEIKEKQTEAQAPVLMDAQAEERVTENINIFRKLCATLNDKKYGETADPLWDEMKAKAELLITGWEKMTDLERGDAMADVMISANKLLCKDGKKKEADENKAEVAGQFRNFFKTTLDRMSVTCRVLALERIFNKVDTMEDDPEVSEKLKKSNESVFKELSIEKYRENYPDISEDDKIWQNVDDLYYRTIYASDKNKMHEANVNRMFADTEEYRKAEEKFKFNRNKTNNILADDFRLDRFGNVIEEDKEKVEQWKKRIKDIADSDSESALKIHKDIVMRVLHNPVNPAWMTEKGFKRNIYEFKAFSRRIGSLENNVTDWNFTDLEKMKAQRAELEKHPAFKIRDEIINQMEWNYTNKMWDQQGIMFGSELHLFSKEVFITMMDYLAFIKDPTKKVLLQDDIDPPFIHKDGTPFEIEKDVDKDGYIKYNKDNPLILEYEYYKEQLTPKVQEMHHMDLIEPMVVKVAAPEEKAIEKLKQLTKDKGDPKEIEKIEKLYAEYINEVRNRANEYDALQKVSPDSVISEEEAKKKKGYRNPNCRNEYYFAAVKYCKSQQKVNELFDELEKTREEFIKKTAGEEALKNWKKELNDERTKRQQEEKHAEREKTSSLERLKKAFIMKTARGEADFFTHEEVMQVQKNKETKGNIKGEEVNRVLDTLILPVYRDFSGAYLTEQDRINAEFNKRYKHAMMYGDAEEIKNISREFTNNFLPLVRFIEPDEMENLDIEKADEKYIDSGIIRYEGVKLSVLSCVNGSTNVSFPLLRTGLDELKEKEPKRYKELMVKLSAMDYSVMQQLMLSLGFDTGRLANIDVSKMAEENREAYNLMVDSYKREHEQNKKEASKA